MPNQGALENFDSAAALEQIAAGKLMHQIATEYGVVKSAIRRRLLRDVTPEDYAQAIFSQAENLVDQATAEIMEVEPDAVLIARARARVDAAHKWAAARDPAKWAPRGNTVNVQLNIGEALGDALMRADQRERDVATNSVAKTTITIDQQPIIVGSTVDAHSIRSQGIDS